MRRELRRTREEVNILRKEESSARTVEDIGKAGREKMEQFYRDAQGQLEEKV